MGTIPTLETGRFLLRPFCQSDAAEVTRRAGDRSVAATAISIPHPYDASMACEWIERQRSGACIRELFSAEISDAITRENYVGAVPKSLVIDAPAIDDQTLIRP